MEPLEALQIPESPWTPPRPPVSWSPCDPGRAVVAGGQLPVREVCSRQRAVLDLGRVDGAGRDRVRADRAVRDRAGLDLAGLELVGLQDGLADVGARDGRRRLPCAEPCRARGRGRPVQGRHDRE